LSLSYLELGKYKDAALVLEYLLNTYPTHRLSYEWLPDLMKVLLSDGRRLDMAKALDKFAPKLPPRINEEKSKSERIESKIEPLILTVHKEAKKTKDPEIWKATDELYRVFDRRFPNAPTPNLWYFGAQRFEGQDRNGDRL